MVGPAQYKYRLSNTARKTSWKNKGNNLARTRDERFEVIIIIISAVERPLVDIDLMYRPLVTSVGSRLGIAWSFCSN